MSMPTTSPRPATIPPTPLAFAVDAIVDPPIPPTSPIFEPFPVKSPVSSVPLSYRRRFAGGMTWRGRRRGGSCLSRPHAGYRQATSSLIVLLPNDTMPPPPCSCRPLPLAIAYRPTLTPGPSPRHRRSRSVLFSSSPIYLLSHLIVTLLLFPCPLPPSPTYSPLAPRQRPPLNHTSVSLNAAVSRRTPLVLWCGRLLSSPAGCRVSSRCICCCACRAGGSPYALVFHAPDQVQGLLPEDVRVGGRPRRT